MAVLDARAMSPFELALLCGVIVAGLVSWNNGRGLLWLAVGVADYLITSAYADLRLPAHAFFTAMVDASVCLLIYHVCHRYGGQKWELPVFTAFQFSVLASFLKVAELASDYSYATLLEVANWLALIAIIGAGTTRLADVWIDGSGRRGDRGRVHRLVSALHAPAKVDTFWFLPHRKAAR